jgi:hypothetical protein
MRFGTPLASTNSRVVGAPTAADFNQQLQFAQRDRDGPPSGTHGGRNTAD